MTESILIRKVSARSIYKLLALGLFTTLPVAGLLFGIAGYFGADTVTINHEKVHGVEALIGGPLIGMSMALFFVVIVGTLTSLGLWLLSLRRPITIRVVFEKST